MFIKEGRHADGMEFHSAGLEKAHAFSPSHGEIHFNDWEHYSIEEKDKSVSLFFVALHEIGHALGIDHSTIDNAVMKKG